MLRNFFIAFSIVAILGAGSVFATPASAQTTDGIQQQIRELLAKVAELTKQLQELKGEEVARPIDRIADVAEHRICKILARNLTEGASGDDVQSLQEFLREQGHLSAEATGYFGVLTRAAVARWQAAQGVDAVGAFGPISRERLRMWCGNPGNNERFGASPQRGEAPLTVAFKTNVQLANPRFVADAGDYKIVFGDGNEITLPCDGDEPFCEGPHSVRHIYREEGTYTATLVHFGYFGIPGPDGGAPENTVARVQIFVGDAPVCTKEYRPVCGAKRVQCITTPCDPVQQTYSNRCMMEADDAAFVHAGACRSAESDRPVACTMDAMQCPDGTYVGRTGPNCQFVCPVSTI